jgi:hypothetical protein
VQAISKTVIFPQTSHPSAKSSEHQCFPLLKKSISEQKGHRHGLQRIFKLKPCQLKVIQTEISMYEMKSKEAHNYDRQKFKQYRDT